MVHPSFISNAPYSTDGLLDGLLIMFSLDFYFFTESYVIFQCF